MIRAATGGMTTKIKVLPGFCLIEHGGDIGGVPGMWPPQLSGHHSSGPMLVTLTSMGPELQSQNRVDVNYEKNTVPIYLKF